MDTVQLRGRARLWLHAQGGRLCWRRSVGNLVVNDGLALCAVRLIGTAQGAISHMAYGSSSTPPNASQTALQGTEHARGTLSLSSSGAIVTATVSFTGPASAVSVAEFGVFNANAGGIMLSRFVVSPFTFGPGETLDVEWQLEFAGA